MTPAPDPTTDRDERLGEAIEAYLELAEGGHPPDPERFAEGYADLGDDLREALAGLAMVQNLVGSTAGGAPGRMLEAGRRVAGYRIVRELGRGGMGTVYEAVHVDLDRPVALKVLGASAAPDSNGRRRFLNEAKTAASLHHTHIVPVFDVGQVGGLCYYAMQRIEGAGLDRVVRAMRRDRTTGAGSSSRRGGRRPADGGHREGPGAVIGTETPDLGLPREERTVGLTASTRAGGLSGSFEPAGRSATGDLLDKTASWSQSGGRRPGGIGPREDEGSPFDPPRGSDYYRWVAQVGRQTGEALAHAHRRHIIHRDIKPSNLLVDGRGSIWVADFGLARRLADPGITHTDSLLGTPRYMSPEQTQAGPIDGRTDVYSLGATLYELLTLRPPFDGQSAADLVQQIRQKDPVAPRRLDPRIPRDLETIVLKAMAKRPADRYATAGALAEDLERFLAYEPVQARRIGPIGRAWRYARRHPSLTAVSTTAAAAVLAVATWAHLNVVQERNEAIKAKGETQRALQQTQIAMQGEQAARRRALWREAQAVRASTITGRRRLGLERLREAASLGDGLDPALRVQLRDEVAEFLVLRDLEPLDPLPTGRTWGLAFVAPPASGSAGGESVGAGEAEPATLVTLNDAGDELQVWEPAHPGAPRRLPLRPGDDGPAPPPLRPGRLFGVEREGESPRFGTGLAAAGAQLAVVRPDGRGVRLIAPATGAVVADLPLAGHVIDTVLAAPDGRRLVTFERVNDRGRPGGRGGPGGPGGGPGGPGGPQLLMRATLWDVARPEAPLAVLADPTAGAEEQRRIRVPLVAFSPDGQTVAVAWSGFGPDATPWIRLVDAETGIEQATIRDVPAAMSALALGPDGMLAVAVGDGSIRLWDASTGPGPGLGAAVGPTASVSTSAPQALPGLYHHQAFVRALRFSPDGTLLAIAGGGSGIELWDPATNQQVATVRTPDRVVLSLEFGPDGRTLVAVGPEQAARWEIVEPDGRARLSSLAGRPSDLALGGDGLVALATWGGPPQLWPSARNSAVVRPLTGAGRAPAVAFDAQGALIAAEPAGLAWYGTPGASHTAGPDRLVPLPEARWSFGPWPPGRAVTATPGLAAASLSAPALNPLTALLPAVVEALVQGGGEPRRGGGPGGPGGGGPGGGGPRPGPFVPLRIAGADGGRRLAVARPGEVLGWRSDAPDAIERLLVVDPERGRGGRGGGGGRGGAVSFWSGLALAPAGDRLYLVRQEPGGRAGALLAYALDPTGAAAPRPLDWADAHGEVIAMALSPDGTTLALSDPAGHIRLVETAHGRTAAVLPPQAETEATVTALAFDAGGRLLAAGHQHGPITLWEVTTEAPRPLMHLPGHPGGVLALAFGPRGHRLASVGDDKVAQVWDLDRLERRLDALDLGW